MKYCTTCTVQIYHWIKFQHCTICSNKELRNIATFANFTVADLCVETSNLQPELVGSQSIWLANANLKLDKILYIPWIKASTSKKNERKLKFLGRNTDNIEHIADYTQNFSQLVLRGSQLTKCNANRVNPLPRIGVCHFTKCKWCIDSLIDQIIHFFVT